MKMVFGEHTISSKDDPHLNQWMSHLHHDMSFEERKELFHEAKRDGQAHFSPRQGVHLVIKHNADGTYTMDRPG